MFSTLVGNPAVSVVSEIKSEMELTPAVTFNEFGGSTRKILYSLQINI